MPSFHTRSLPHSGHLTLFSTVNVGASEPEHKPKEQKPHRKKGKMRETSPSIVILSLMPLSLQQNMKIINFLNQLSPFTKHHNHPTNHSKQHENAPQTRQTELKT